VEWTKGFLPTTRLHDADEMKVRRGCNLTERQVAH